MRCAWLRTACFAHVILNDNDMTTLAIKLSMEAQHNYEATYALREKKLTKHIYNAHQCKGRHENK
eukprot:16436018-Heterocapsa_arctica.AAC.1